MIHVPEMNTRLIIGLICLFWACNNFSCAQSITNSNMKDDLLTLDAYLNDPFRMEKQMEDFSTHPVVQKIVASGSNGPKSLLPFVADTSDPTLARIALVTLSQLDPTLFYADLLTMLESKGQKGIEPLDAGLWKIKVPEEQIATDLMKIVQEKGNPYPLILLQRPIAKAVKSELIQLIEKDEAPSALYALYCLRYCLSEDDIPLLKSMAGNLEKVTTAAHAGVYLLKLKNTAGIPGVRAGLTGENQKLRTSIFFGIWKLLPEQLIKEANYNPSANQEELKQSAEIILAYFSKTYHSN